MIYKVQFIGLACFVRDGAARHVLLPDGRQPANEIAPHFGSIVVAADAVRSFEGWDGDAFPQDGTFLLSSPCSIELPGTDGEGGLDTAQHDVRLPQLRRIDPAFEVDVEHAQTIADLHIRRGRLEAFRIPGGDAVISQLDVPHEGDIEVVVTPRDPSQPKRTICLKPETEIVLANISAGGLLSAAEDDNHFQLYDRLTTQAVTLPEPPVDDDIPRSPSMHPIFQRRSAIGLSARCSNTGCCSP